MEARFPWNFVNGKSESKISTTYSFYAQATKAGKYKFSAAAITVDNKEINSNEYELTVVKGKNPTSQNSSDKNLFIKVEVSKKNIVGISTGRAGNVIGGGDWSQKRLIPDSIKYLRSNKSIYLRNPNFNRPWQFVLEPLRGYLLLAMKQFYKPKKYYLLHFE